MTSSTSTASVSPTPSSTRDRKAEHIELALEKRMQLERSAFDRYSFDHCALPEIDLSEIDTSCEFLGKELASPLLISCMTGGTGVAEKINHNLLLQQRHAELLWGSAPNARRWRTRRPQRASR